uniref:MAM domain containing glycosylphosphatidylinositol anchor 1 n=1 Tax=Hucho hucho TaxID=62062 RepID=A0A4W5QR48_9TELE
MKPKGTNYVQYLTGYHYSDKRLYPFKNKSKPFFLSVCVLCLREITFIFIVQLCMCRSACLCVRVYTPCSKDSGIYGVCKRLCKCTVFVHICMCVCEEYSHAVSQGLLLLYLCNQSMFYVTQGETKVLKLKNLRLKDFANYTCQVSIRNVCEIPDSSGGSLSFLQMFLPFLNVYSLLISLYSSPSLLPTYLITPTCPVCSLPHSYLITLPLPFPLLSPSPSSYPIFLMLSPSSLFLSFFLILSTFSHPILPYLSLPFSFFTPLSLLLPSFPPLPLPTPPSLFPPSTNSFLPYTPPPSLTPPHALLFPFPPSLTSGMGNLTFQITPDSNKDSESIQMGRDLKLSCHVDAQPQDKVNYTWYQNAVLIYNSDSLIVLRSDPDMAPGTSSLEIVDMKFRDQATYSCVANFPGSTVPELRVDVNITQSSVTPPILTVPEGGQVVSVREGGTTDLVCLVDGKPRPPVLWSRADKDLAMPTGEWAVETRDGRLRLTNITRDLMGAYRCQTAPYNGLNIKPRQAQVQLNVQYAPVLDPVFQDVRSPNYQFVTLRCIIQKSNPPRMASVRWTRNGEPLTSLTSNPQENPQLKFKLDPSNNGTYKCHVSNGVGSSTCTFNISSRPYNAEFYFDTPNPIRNLKGNNFSYNLQWTQREPAATDRIIGYWVNVRNMNQMNLFSKQIDKKEPVKGGLMSYILTDLKIPLSYEIRLAPITTYSTGDYVSRTIKYSEPYNYQRPSDHVCGFEDKHICGFSQDRGDNFDWTRQNHLTQNPKCSSNTGPEMDRSGTKEGYYMYIEASRPRVLGDTARLLSPLYNVTASRGPKGSGRLPYCISFFYHMKGKQIGTLDVLLRVKSIASVDTKVWSLIGNQGPDWNQANIIVNPSGPFQVVFQAIRGSGYEGDIAIDDVLVTKGKCKQENSVSNTGMYVTILL